MAVSVKIVSTKVLSSSPVVSIHALDVLVVSIGGVQSTCSASERQCVVVVEQTEQTDSTTNRRNRFPFVCGLFSPPILGISGGWGEDGTCHEGKGSDLDDIFHVHLLVKAKRA